MNVIFYFCKEMKSCSRNRKVYIGPRGGHYYKSKGRKVYCSRDRIGPLRKGSLSRHGYGTSKSASARHRALAKAVKAEGALAVFRKLNAVMVLNKNTNPSVSAKFKADRNWVKRTYM